MYQAESLIAPKALLAKLLPWNVTPPRYPPDRRKPRSTPGHPSDNPPRVYVIDSVSFLPPDGTRILADTRVRRCPAKYHRETESDVPVYSLWFHNRGSVCRLRSKRMSRSLDQRCSSREIDTFPGCVSIGHEVFFEGWLVRVSGCSSLDGHRQPTVLLKVFEFTTCGNLLQPCCQREFRVFQVPRNSLLNIKQIPIVKVGEELVRTKLFLSIFSSSSWFSIYRVALTAMIIGKIEILN